MVEIAGAAFESKSQSDTRQPVGYLQQSVQRGALPALGRENAEPGDVLDEVALDEL